MKLFSLPWIQDHLLAIVAVVLTIVLIYHYLIEKGSGVKLSKRYRNSIFEAQSKIFLNATQYLIKGDKNLAIREFLNAVDLNRETMETYFALGGLFRSNGEIGKAISIHRSLIARESISETDRIRALKELALDFDKGGFIEKAISTYKDVLKINREQEEVIKSLCRIYEDTQDWEEAYNFRVMLSKVGRENQAETISHILVQKSKQLFSQQKFKECKERLEEAFRFAPSVSAKILSLKLDLHYGNMDKAKDLFVELVKAHPIYTSFIFESLSSDLNRKDNEQGDYQTRFDLIKNFFLSLDDEELMKIPSVVLSKVRLLKEQGENKKAHQIMSVWIEQNERPSEAMRTEYIKLLIDLDNTKVAVSETKKLLENYHQTLTKHYCSNCGYNSDEIFWRCHQCYQWETIQFRWKV